LKEIFSEEKENKDKHAMKNATKMKTQFRILGWMLLTLASINSQAQDVHFSQYYTTPLQVNPAKAGFFNGNVRMAGIYKNQWSSVTAPYSTFSGSIDFSAATAKGKEGNIVGFGLLATSDKAGDAAYTTTQVGGTFAIHKRIGKWGNQFISVGSSLTYNNTHFDQSMLHWDNEYFGKPANENFLSTTSYADFSLGTEYNFCPAEGNNFNLGIGLFHINQPELSFNNQYGAVLYRKFLFNTGAEFRMSQKFQLYPRAMLAIQGGHHEVNVGSFLRIRLDKSRNPRYNVYLGTWYRVNDAFVAVTRFDIDNFSFAFSYDVNSSSLTKASYGMGGPELSFLYTSALSSLGSKKVYCPRF